jgi:hypothetical protein
MSEQSLMTGKKFIFLKIGSLGFNVKPETVFWNDLRFFLRGFLEFGKTKVYSLIVFLQFKTLSVSKPIRNV